MRTRIRAGMRTPTRTRARTSLVRVGCAMLLGAVGAGSVDAQEAHLVVVTGLGGDPAYTDRFRDWGSRLVAAARDGNAGSVVWLAERADLHPSVTGEARKEAVARAVAGLGERSAPSDLVVLALFGHGSARDGETRLNLPGPDLTAGELAAWLEPLAPRRIVVVNTASASGGFVEPLSAPGRVVITATRTARETQATRFGGHFVDALTGAGADTDKDGRVSMLEAFEYARREVAREFASANALPTEHALLDDDGDGAGSLEPAARPDSDGAVAATLALATRTGGAVGPGAAGETTAAVAEAAADATADPALRELLEEKARLESALAELRSREGSMPAEEYRAELERLLLDIARNGRAIRERQEGTGG